MGIRTYIGWLSKEKYDLLKDLTNEDRKKIINILDLDIDDDDEYNEEHGLYVTQSNIADDYFEVCDIYLPDPSEAGVSEFFNNLKTHSEFSTYVIDQTILLKLINATEKLINDTYKRDLDKFFENGLLKEDIEEQFNSGQLSKSLIRDLSVFLFNIKNKASSNGHYPVWDDFYLDSRLNTKLDSEFISNSSYYEESVYDLVRIYKSFDWNNNVLVWQMW